MKDELTLSDFLYGPLIYGEAFKHIVIPISPKTLYIETVKNRNNTFTLKVSNFFKIDELKIEISSGANSKKSKPTKTTIKDGILEFNYQFNSSGHYDFHIKLKDETIVTYMINVKRK